MLKPNCLIEIKDNDTKKVVMFDYVNELEINTSTQNFTDTAKIIVPRKLSHKGKSITEFIKRNNSVSIKLAYGNDFKDIFSGYVVNVSKGTPITIECENEAWNLKQMKLPATYYDKLIIKDFVKKWMPDYTSNIAEVDLGEVRINEETTLARVFEYFMTNYPVKLYFRNKTFFGILPNTMTFKEGVKVITFKIGYNTISDNLTYTLAEDVKLQIVAKAITKDNKKLEWKEPHDTDKTVSEPYEIRTFLVPGAETLDQLKEYAINQLKNFKVDKMTGDFTVFGEPHVRKGDIVHLFDEDYAEKNDKRFFVEAVVYRFGQSGYRQTITLGGQIK